MITLLSFNPSGLHSQTPRPGAVEGLGSGRCLPLVANLVLMVFEEPLEADPKGCVGSFGLTDGAGPVAPATICGCVRTTVL